MGLQEPKNLDGGGVLAAEAKKTGVASEDAFLIHKIQLCTIVYNIACVRYPRIQLKYAHAYCMHYNYNELQNMILHWCDWLITDAGRESPDAQNAVHVDSSTITQR